MFPKYILQIYFFGCLSLWAEYPPIINIKPMMNANDGGLNMYNAIGQFSGKPEINMK